MQQKYFFTRHSSVKTTSTCRISKFYFFIFVDLTKSITVSYKTIKIILKNLLLRFFFVFTNRKCIFLLPLQPIFSQINNYLWQQQLILEMVCV